MQLELKKYLQSVLALEKDYHAVSLVREGILSEIQNTQKNEQKLSPEYPVEPYKHLPTEIPKPNVTVKLLLLINAVISILIPLIISFIKPCPISTLIVTMIEMFFVFLVVFFGVPLIYVIKGQNEYKKYLNEVEKAEQEHARKMVEYNNAVTRADAEYQRKLVLIQGKRSELDKQLEDIWNQCNTIRSALDKIYSADIVFKKYRSLVPIAMFCEYLESGRCTELEGHEGAYNVYESELRQNIIIDKLDTISEKLDNIRNNQYVLYESISDASRRAQAVFQEVSQNSLLAAQAAESNVNYQRKQTKLLEMNNQIAEDIRNIEFYNTFIK